MGARYYDGHVGRFISRDTLLTQKPYLYCNRDPVNGLDPTGHYAEWNPVTWDYGFNNDDWVTIENNIDDWGDKEIYIGSGGLIGGGIGWGSPSPGQYVPRITRPTWYPQPEAGNTWTWGIPGEPAQLGGVVGAVGAGVAAGGLVAKGIAWVLRQFD